MSPELLAKLRRWRVLHDMPSPKGWAAASEEVELEHKLERMGLYPFINDFDQLSVAIGEYSWNK